ncbi:MAG: SUMF1/EgtB/PvdO family nonheme iron enzyme [Pelolinea sp.]|nr:SUMF1/EgtB/PvdO family nonheme iron enzyme [Pelolinea sp.]
MNKMQRKSLAICLAIFAVLIACQIKFSSSPTSTPETEPAFVPSIVATATQISSKDGMAMVYVPAGAFKMGSTDKEVDAIYSECHDDIEMPCKREWFENELPAHIVFLDAYWIDQTEVTNYQYQMCMKTGGCAALMSNESYSRDSYFGNIIFNNFPVVYVDWYMASAYCQWADRRLPTEAEWEKAARGTDGRKYPWGNGSPNAGLLNYSYDQNDTAEVGSYPAGASPYGALDMAGNVEEWTADWFDAGYYGISPADNPQGPSSGEKRVTRGGGWGDSTDYILRSPYRGSDKPLLPALRYYLGFRCAASAATIQPPLATLVQAGSFSQETLMKTVVPDFQNMSGILPPGTKVNGVRVMPDGTPWIYSDAGIFGIDKTGQVKLLFDQPVSDLQGIDQSGRVWALGENYKFIAAYDGQDWQVYGSDQGWVGLPDGPYLSPGRGDGLAADLQSRIWIATGTDILRLYEPGTDTWRSLSSAQLGFPFYDNADYQGYFLTDTLTTETGEVWLSACIGEGEVLRPFGIWYSDGNRWLELDAANQDCVLDMAAGSNGVIWAGGFDALLKYDPQANSWARVTLPPFDRRQIVSHISINPINGLPWIQVVRYGGASMYGSLAYYHLNPSGWVLDMESPSFSDIGTAFEPDGTAWMCGDGRVMKSDGTVLNEVANLNLIDCQISIDGVGRVWAVDVDKAELWMLNKAQD